MQRTMLKACSERLVHSLMEGLHAVSAGIRILFLERNKKDWSV